MIGTCEWELVTPNKPRSEQVRKIGCHGGTYIAMSVIHERRPYVFCPWCGKEIVMKGEAE